MNWEEWCYIDYLEIYDSRELIRKLHGIKSAVLFKVRDALRITNSYSIQHYFIFSQSAIKDDDDKGWVWSAGVKWKPRTLIRSMKNGPRLLTKYNKTHPYLTLWLNFDFWCFPAFLVLQREFHYFINTVLSDNGLIVSCTKSYVKLVATSQRMMKSAFKLFLYQSRRNHLK